MTYAHTAGPCGFAGRHAFSERSDRPEGPHRGHGHGPRHRQPAGEGSFEGRGPKPGRRGGPGRGRRRRGDVRQALLQLLAEEPRNGYQLMEAIEERTAGRWRPSPGSVYPTLAQLEDEGLIRASERDGTKLFELTDVGRQQVAERAEAASPWDEPDSPGDETRHEVRTLVHQVMHAVHEVGRAGDASQLQRARQVLADTRRSLYLILAGEPVDAAGPADADAPADANAPADNPPADAAGPGEGGE